VEVEIGYLVGDMSLDKDGVRCGAVFNELAAELYGEGKSCMDRLAELDALYGHSSMLNGYFHCDNPDTFASIFSRIRTMGPDGGYPREVGGYRVASVRDVPLGLDTREADGKSRLPRVTDSFMVTLRYEDGATLTLRNSGTEPKLKFYIERVVGGGAAAAVDSGEKARVACEEMKRKCIEELLEPAKNGLTAR
jgi:phosphoglucomutase